MEELYLMAKTVFYYNYIHKLHNPRTTLFFSPDFCIHRNWVIPLINRGQLHLLKTKFSLKYVTTPFILLPSFIKAQIGRKSIGIYRKHKDHMFVTLL